MLKTIKIFLFIIGCIALALFFAVEHYTKEIENAEKLNREYLVLLTLERFFSNSSGVHSYLIDTDFQEITDDEKMVNIYTSGKEIAKNELKIGSVSVMDYQNKHFLVINDKNNVRVYENLHSSDMATTVARIAFLVFFAFLLLTYFVLKRNLKPLKSLAEHIKNWSNEETHKEFIYKKSDEIGLLAKEFNKAAKKNDELVLSRQFFLRAIMHELKTPIGKGMILIDLPQNEKNKNTLRQVFLRINSLLDEFKKIEAILSKHHKLELQECKYSYLYEQTLNALFLEKDSVVSVKIQKDESIEVDLELFIVLLKNLIDNALKYSSDGLCEVVFDKKYILVKNNGEKLTQDIKEYFKPFIRGNTNKPGYGLGLYLINYVCNTSGFKLEYFYDNCHNFKVIL